MRRGQNLLSGSNKILNTNGGVVITVPDLCGLWHRHRLRVCCRPCHGDNLTYNGTAMLALLVAEHFRNLKHYPHSRLHALCVLICEHPSTAHYDVGRILRCPNSASLQQSQNKRDQAPQLRTQTTLPALPRMPSAPPFASTLPSTRHSEHTGIHRAPPRPLLHRVSISAFPQQKLGRDDSVHCCVIVSEHATDSSSLETSAVCTNR